MKITNLTHWLALGIVAVAGVLITPAAQTILKPYPIAEIIGGAIIAIAALYKNPTTKQ